jgi:hypothetical protein
MRRNRARLVAVVVLAIALMLLVALWAKATNGSKQAEMSATLIGGVVVGLILLAVEWLFTSEAEKRETAKAASFVGEGGETIDTRVDPMAAVPTEVPPVATHEADAPEMETVHFYRVEYDNTIRDTSRVDALQLRLRVYRDDDYFQFFTVTVPAPELRGFIGPDANVRRGQLWFAIAQAAGPHVEDAVRRGEVPLEDPRRGYEVFPDIERAVHRARRESGTLPEVQSDDTVFEFSDMGLLRRVADANPVAAMTQAMDLIEHYLRDEVLTSIPEASHRSGASGLAQLAAHQNLISESSMLAINGLSARLQQAQTIGRDRASTAQALDFLNVAESALRDLRGSPA